MTEPEFEIMAVMAFTIVDKSQYLSSIDLVPSDISPCFDYSPIIIVWIHGNSNKSS